MVTDMHTRGLANFDGTRLLRRRTKRVACVQLQQLQRSVPRFTAVCARSLLRLRAVVALSVVSFCARVLKYECQPKRTPERSDFELDVGGF